MFILKGSESAIQFAYLKLHFLFVRCIVGKMLFECLYQYWNYFCISHAQVSIHFVYNLWKYFLYFLCNQTNDTFSRLIVRKNRIILFPAIRLPLHRRHNTERICQVLYVCLESSIRVLDEPLCSNDSLYVQSTLDNLWLVTLCGKNLGSWGWRGAKLT